ncbi:glycoside hydrolase family 15 protein [Acuticoccus sp. M5D2P5]|uniref:glycoside hydrolase family 15 protein n=1 Tax=Acuticoccus kalidii TaxID=2910977 RepID=UPI001F46C1B7|nr:glycoside hydrolase family 15 protein [Acuticoccus kalidii]MCF3933008.1 glycoside hydrolase family 15 protein [Acuticoccus kalidii]
MAYHPIDSYAVIGDMHSAALVNINGSIDWLCLPRFDSPSVFAAILDDEKGGYFRIHPVGAEDTKWKQYYWPSTNVLVTRFLLPEAAAELVDFMPVGPDMRFTPTRRQVVRRITAVRGKLTLRLVCKPAFNYARDPHTVELHDRGALFRSDGTGLELLSSVPLRIEGDAIVCEFTLKAGETAAFALCEVRHDARVETLPVLDATEEAFRVTVKYWRDWLSQSTYRGRWREMVERSALALKLMTYEPTGAIVAAPTCSLPEEVGGERNWDYRYSWLRDSAFTIYSLVRLGFTEEATRFADFLHNIAAHPSNDGSLQIMYGIDGRHDLTEETLDHLDGYRGSKPVRIGNGAYDQLQLDIYGELLDALFLYNRDVRPIGLDAWLTVTRIVDWVCDHWEEPDEGVWETRGGRQHFVYSKLMCWVAIDRGLRIANDRSLPADVVRWRETRDAIYWEIMNEGWNEELGIFVQHYGSETLDASNLMMVMTSFLSPGETRAKRLIDAVMKLPEDGGLVVNSLVYRYNLQHTVDGLSGEEGTFNLCTFWLVNALARMGRTDPARLDDAILIFERMLGFANHVGLYAEETGPSGEGLGNFPQAFTHLGLITAAVNLNRALDGDD